MFEKISLTKNKKKKTYLSSLSEHEKRDIEERVKFDLEQTHYDTLSKMTKIGGLANAIGGLFVVLVLYHQINLKTLLGWYGVLLFINLINIIWSEYFRFKYKMITPSLLKRWHSGLYLLMTALCLTWGSIGILFTPYNPYYQLYVITFLQVVVLSYAFPATIDFPLALISLCSLLLPTIGYRLFAATQQWETPGYDFVLNIAFGISLFILGAFLLVVCYLGYILTKSQSTLSFLNAALNEKLENMNNILEQRVKERTIELEKSLELVTYQATHDLLTDLPNQRLLSEYMDAAIASALEGSHMFGVILFSINEMEKINDGLGYQAGELVIRVVAHRFRDTFINNGHEHTHYNVTLSRKDIFIILLEPAYSIEEIETKAKKLLMILDKPVHTEKQTLKLTASIGVSVYPRDGKDMSTLLMNADTTMFNAKQKGGNYVSIYQATSNTDFSKQLEIEKNLHAALQNNEFYLLYQPVIDLNTGLICGAEALVRWKSPIFGNVVPDLFISIAESTGVIVALGDWVLYKACQQLKQWHTLGFPALHIAVNLSAKQLFRENITSKIEDILTKTGVSPESIELELTESVAFQKEVVPILNQISKMKIKLSIDDFGTGFSGLSNLKLFTINTLKIDKSFVRDLATDSDSRAIVSNIIMLAKKINVRVIAEGVESEEQLEFLKQHGCDMIQGYYFSQPIDAEAFIDLLRKQG